MTSTNDSAASIPIADSAASFRQVHLNLTTRGDRHAVARWSIHVDKRIIRWSDWFQSHSGERDPAGLKESAIRLDFYVARSGRAFVDVSGHYRNDSEYLLRLDGRSMLSGYIVILLVPAFIIIPQAAFRSMASELDDGTFETLSLSMLKPTHILFGKLNVAVLQLIVYMSIVAPCIAMTYLLRGCHARVDPLRVFGGRAHYIGASCHCHFAGCLFTRPDVASYLLAGFHRDPIDSRIFYHGGTHRDHAARVGRLPCRFHVGRTPGFWVAPRFFTLGYCSLVRQA